MELHGSSDQRYASMVQPAHWENPTPATRYDLVVIGGGASGIAAAREAKLCGAKHVALIEATRLGGDRLTHGTVPFLSLLTGARKAAHITDIIERNRHFVQTLEMMRRKRAKLASAISAERLVEEGIDLFFGTARFHSPSEVMIDWSGNSELLLFSKALITTGARATIPQLAGFDQIPFRTPETLYDFEKVPERMAILGGGGQGVEIAQVFARFGTRVTLIDKADRLISEAELYASDLLERTLADNGVQIKLHTSVTSAKKVEGALQLQINRLGNDELLEVDEVAIAIGTTPNTHNLSLELAGVETVQNGVFINDNLQTTNRQIYACGNVIGDRLSRQTAEAQAILAVRNAIRGERGKLSELVAPWLIFTDPEIAHVGSSSEELTAKEIPFQRLAIDFTDQERGVIEEEEGVLEILIAPNGTILGASAIHSIAGELLAEISLAMARKLKLQDLAGVHRPFATRIRALSDLAEEQKRLQPKGFFSSILQRIPRK